MSNQFSSKDECDDQDPLWNLIRRDACRCDPSPWFVTRTVAKALSTRQSHGILTTPSLLRRLLLPIPLVGMAALLLVAVHLEQKSCAGIFVSSEDEFEQHMEMLVSSDSGI